MLTVLIMPSVIWGAEAEIEQLRQIMGKLKEEYLDSETQKAIKYSEELIKLIEKEDSSLLKQNLANYSKLQLDSKSKAAIEALGKLADLLEDSEQILKDKNQELINLDKNKELDDGLKKIGKETYELMIQATKKQISSYWNLIRPVAGLLIGFEMVNLLNKGLELEHYSVVSSGVPCTTYINGTVKNNSDNYFNFVSVDFNLYAQYGGDEDKSLIGNARDSIANLKPHSQWRFHAYSYEKCADSVEFSGFTKY